MTTVTMNKHTPTPYAYLNLFKPSHAHMYLSLLQISLDTARMGFVVRYFVFGRHACMIWGLFIRQGPM